MRIIIAGNGITLYFLAKRFISRGWQVSIVSDSWEDCDYCTRNLKALVIHGHYSDPELILQARPYEADIFIGMTGQDQDNLVLCQMAQVFHQIPRILAVVNDPDNEDVFRKIGIKAISNSRFLIESIESMSAIDEIRQQFSVVEGRVVLTELVIAAVSAVNGKALQEIILPGGVLVASILRGDEVIIPQGKTRLQSGDRILLISQPENQAVALNVFG